MRDAGVIVDCSIWARRTFAVLVICTTECLRADIGGDASLLTPPANCEEAVRTKRTPFGTHVLGFAPVVWHASDKVGYLNQETAWEER